jgi:hypothetical protein
MNRLLLIAALSVAGTLSLEAQSPIVVELASEAARREAA